LCPDSNSPEKILLHFEVRPPGLSGVAAGVVSGVGVGGGEGMSALANRGSKSSRMAS
jgi:hypothetical protein